MTKVKILIEGYVKKVTDGWLATPSTVLVRDRGKIVLADPGSDKELLLKKLRDENLHPEDIDMVFLTHHHLDHILNLRAFPGSVVLLAGDMMIMDGTNKLVLHGDVIPGTGIDVVKTPGHAMEHQSLLVKTPEGVICVAGDLFWWFDGEAQKTDQKSLLDRKDPFVKDRIALQTSREKILKMADWIIPGHGVMFKVGKIGKNSVNSA